MADEQGRIELVPIMAILSRTMMQVGHLEFNAQSDEIIGVRLDEGRVAKTVTIRDASDKQAEYTSLHYNKNEVLDRAHDVVKRELPNHDENLAADIVTELRRLGLLNPGRN